MTIFEERLDLMLFRRTREERSKLKEKKRQLEELKKSVSTPENQQTASPQPNNESSKPSSKPTSCRKGG